MYQPLVGSAKARKNDEKLPGDVSSEDASKTSDEASERLVNVIIADIENAYRTSSEYRPGILFYDIVVGGNVSIVEQVLSAMEQRGMQAERNWILGLNLKDGNTDRHLSDLHKFAKFWVFLLVACIFVVLTPIFYFVHGLCIFFYSRVTRVSIHCPQLPFFTAVRSKNADMIRLFMENGVGVTDRDKHGNNVYHHLANLSAEDPQRAIECHKSLIMCVEEVHILSDTIMAQDNRDGLTPFEALAKYGSIEFLNIVADEEGVFGRTVVSASNYGIEVAQDVVRRIEGVSSSGVVLDRERYQDTVGLDQHAQPLTSVVQNHHKLLPQKHHSTMRRRQYDVNQYERGDVHGRQSCLLQLVACRDVEEMSAKEVGCILQARFLREWMKSKYKWCKRILYSYHFTQLLFTVLLMILVNNPPADDTYHPMSAKIANVSLGFLERTLKIIITNLVIKLDKGDLAMNDNSTVFSLDEVCDQASCTEVVAKLIREECPMTPLSTLEAVIENTYGYDHTNRPDILVHILLGFAIFSIFWDLHYRLLFLLQNFPILPHHNIDLQGSLYAVMGRWITGSYIERQLNLLTFSLIPLYVYFLSVDSSQIALQDIHFNVSAIAAAGIDPHTMDVTIATYIQNHLYALRQYVHFVADSTAVITYVIMLCLMIRFMAFVYTLRLLPSVGFFIITARKLAMTLFHFIIVYFLVSLAFASVLYFVLRDPDCPNRRMAESDTLSKNLFQIYLVILGQDVRYYYESDIAQISFILYTGISILLLLNLIIAVMSSLAESLNRRPWKEVLCLVERWDEVLGMEATWQALLCPLRIGSRAGMVLYRRLAGTFDEGGAVIEIIYYE